jgi:hypothetical protein
MRITNPTNQTPINAVENATTPPPRPDSTTSKSASESASSASADAYSLVPSFELLSLNAILQQIPPVRADVLAETIQRLASGQLRTSKAIEQTARALLG